MTPTEITLALIAAAIIGFLVGRTRRSMELHEAGQRIRDLRLALTFASTLGRAQRSEAFALAFLSGQTDLIARYWPDFYTWRIREIDREEQEGVSHV